MADTDPRSNALLSALPPDAWARISGALECVDMSFGDVVCEPGARLRHLYFPTTAIISMLQVMENGESAEIAMVGNEGVVGVALLMGAHSTVSRVVVQTTGQAYRIKAQALLDEFERASEVRGLLLRYTLALMTQMTQTAACYRHHSLHQQLCRWLLLLLDRTGGTELVVTQELISTLLGVRRESVNEAALRIQTEGFIRYSRGRIAVLNRPGLEKCACECYEVVKREYDRLLPSS